MIVGTAGHVDHGKTALVRAITGVDADRLKEEKARGITIDLGFAYWPQDDGGVIGFVDVPGHERLVHTMVAGAQGIDLILLVVAADDGVMPQTREHLEVLDLLGLRRGVVALTKADLVDADRLAQVSAEIAAALTGTGLDGADIYPLSSVTGAGIPALMDRLRAEAAVARRHDADLDFRLAVDRSFTLAGAGTVVTGIVLAGQVAPGDRVVVSPAGIEGRVRSLHAQNRPADIGRAGDRCALNLAGPAIAKEAIRRGDMVVAPHLHAPTQRIDADLRLVGGVASLGQWAPARLHHAAGEVGVRIVTLDGSAVQLVLERAIAACAGDRFILRDVSARRNIGGGRFLDLRPPERRRRAPERAVIRAAWAEADHLAALRALLAVAPHVVEPAAFARDRGLTLAAAIRLKTAGADLTNLGTALASKAWRDGVVAAVEARLGDFHRADPDLPGMGIEQLRLAVVPGLPAALFRVLLRQEADDGRIALDGGWARQAGHAIALAPEDQAVWAEIAPLISDGERFRPPRVRDIARTLGEDEERVRRLMKRLMRAGIVAEVAHDHFFLRPTVAEMFAIVCAISASHAEGWFVAGELRDRLDNGRKVAIQILEYFDRLGATLRRGDRRRPNPHRLDLFSGDGS